MEIRGLHSEDVWEHENAFYWFAESTRLNKALAQYELYKRITGLPGDVLELGVHKGASLIRFAQFRELLETQDSRRMVGFDVYGEFPRGAVGHTDDLSFIARFEAAAGQALSKDELSRILSSKHLRNIELVQGDVLETLPSYLEGSPEVRIALLHLDMDVYEPTRFALETCFELVVQGGLIVIDDYGAVSGATRATDEFAAERDLVIRKLPYYRVPAFITR